MLSDAIQRTINSIYPQSPVDKHRKLSEVMLTRLKRLIGDNSMIIDKNFFEQKKSETENIIRIKRKRKQIKQQKSLSQDKLQLSLPENKSIQIKSFSTTLRTIDEIQKPQTIHSRRTSRSTKGSTVPKKKFKNFQFLNVQNIPHINVNKFYDDNIYNTIRFKKTQLPIKSKFRSIVLSNKTKKIRQQNKKAIQYRPWSRNKNQEEIIPIQTLLD